jgi:hypothetical protein
VVERVFREPDRAEVERPGANDRGSSVSERRIIVTVVLARGVDGNVGGVLGVSFGGGLHGYAAAGAADVPERGEDDEGEDDCADDAACDGACVV